MKKFLRLTFITVVLAFACNSSFAQKIGIIDINALIMVMPERDSVSIKFAALQKDKEDTYEMMTTEYTQKFQDYQQNVNTWTESTKSVKDRELIQMQQRISEYEASAQEELQAAYQELLQPIYKKAQDAIKKVAQSRNIDFVIDSNAGIHYYNESTVTNLLELVKADLGIKN